MKKNTLQLFLLLAIILFSCKSEKDNLTDSNAIDKDALFVVHDFTDSVFTAGIEGPAVDAQGNLYLVSYLKDGNIGKVTPDGVVSLFVQLPTGSTGNGIRFNSHGDMLIADYTGHNLLKLDMKSKAVSTYAHDANLNQPNDVAIMKNDIAFCSDPNWSNNTGKLWKVSTDGTFHLLESSMGTTNGVEVGTGDTVLYVNESVQRNVWAYSLATDGAISNKRLLIKFNDFGMDGMRCDEKGNLYIARYEKGVIAVVSPQGELISEIQLKGKKPTNITFGGSDGKTCYVTLQDRGIVETFRNDIKGR